MNARAIKSFDVIVSLMVVTILAVNGCQLFKGSSEDKKGYDVFLPDETSVGEFMLDHADELAAYIDHENTHIYVLEADVMPLKKHLEVEVGSETQWTLIRNGKTVSYGVVFHKDFKQAAVQLKGEKDFKGRSFVLRDRSCEIVTEKAGVCINLISTKTGKFTRSLKTPKGGFATCMKMAKQYCTVIVRKTTIGTWDKRNCKGKFTPNDTFKIRLCANDDT